MGIELLRRFTRRDRFDDSALSSQGAREPLMRCRIVWVERDCPAKRRFGSRNVAAAAAVAKKWPGLCSPVFRWEVDRSGKLRAHYSRLHIALLHVQWRLYHERPDGH